MIKINIKKWYLKYRKYNQILIIFLNPIPIQEESFFPEKMLRKCMIKQELSDLIYLCNLLNVNI